MWQEVGWAAVCALVLFVLTSALLGLLSRVLGRGREAESPPLDGLEGAGEPRPG